MQAMPGTSRAGCHGEGLGVWKVWLGAAGRPEGCLEGFVWERRGVRKFSLERRDIRKVGVEWGWERRDVRRDVRKVGVTAGPTGLQVAGQGRGRRAAAAEDRIGQDRNGARWRP